MNKEPQISILSCAEDSLSALKKLVIWADEIHLAYAWVHSSNGKAAHWEPIPLNKIQRAVIGIHFAQTEPLALRTLSKLSNALKVIADTKGVYHPKLIIGIKGNSMAAILGSSNLTNGGFFGNTEINVLIEGSKELAAMLKLRNFMDEQWESPRAFVPDKDWFESYEVAYKNRPRPPHAPKEKLPSATVIQSANEINVSWQDYYGLIVEQELRTIGKGYVVHVFDHEDGSYMQEVENCQKAFNKYASFAEMPEDRRKMVSGWGGGTTGLFGSMKGAGTFKNIVSEYPEIISKHLDVIPLKNNIPIGLISTYLTNMSKVAGINLGTSTRLLGMKRPDYFLPINDGNKKRIREIFGPAPSTASGYIKFHEKLWSCPWFNSPEPTKKDELRVWRARVALLDAVLYEIPEKLL